MGAGIVELVPLIVVFGVGGVVSTSEPAVVVADRIQLVLGCLRSIYAGVLVLIVGLG